tara:strand:- start:1444 stop:1554 length:111 start_codon:yes stop_codon:yes gene_type:complete
LNFFKKIYEFDIFFKFENKKKEEIILKIYGLNPNII